MSEIREKVAPIRSAGPVERVAFVPERGPQRPRRVKRGSTPERKFLSMGQFASTAWAGPLSFNLNEVRIEQFHLVLRRFREADWHETAASSHAYY